MKQSRLSILAIMAILLTASCSRGVRMSRELAAIDSLVDANPDSALVLLGRMDAGKENTSFRMYLELLRGKAMNKCDVLFTTDSVMLEVARYFDLHGNRNQRMLAHYVLGCSYRDLGDAPQAIEVYQRAVECADTLREETDFRTLSCIYSQMADVYNRQLALGEETECRKQSIKYSLLLNDSTNAAYDYCVLAGSYILQNKKGHAEKCLLKAKAIYENLGHSQEWLELSPILMHLYLDEKGRLDDVKKLIDKFDSESVLFNDKHELAPSKRQFYYYKGSYFENMGNLDSAEFYYRKIYRDNMGFNDKDPMYRGLLSVYEKKGFPDSVAKYALLYCESNDSSIAIKDRELTLQMSASYNYANYQKKARLQEQRSAKMQRWAIMISIVTAGIVLTFAYIWKQLRKRAKRREKELQAVRDDYEKTKEEYTEKTKTLNTLRGIQKEVIDILQKELESAIEDSEEAKTKLYMLDKKYQESLKTYTNETEMLKDRIDELSKHKVLADNIKRSNVLMESDIYGRITVIAENPILGITDREWKELTKIFAELYPDLVYDLNAKNIKKQGFQVCLLSALNLRISDIARMVNLNIQRTTNLRLEINKTLFHEDYARTLNKNLSQRYEIYI